MKSVLHRTWAEIDTAAIVRNYQTVKQGLAPTCRCMAVVKANAYGHGAVAVATALAKAGADWFGVSNLNEAIELREGGITAPILILAYTPPEHAERLAQYHLTQAVLDGEYAARLEAAAAAADVTVNAHVALDTGMSRIGFFCQGETPLDELTAACTLPHVKVSGIFTHFAVADTPSMDEVTQTQFRRFTDTAASRFPCATAVTVPPLSASPRCTSIWCAQASCYTAPPRRRKRRTSCVYVRR